MIHQLEAIQMTRIDYDEIPESMQLSKKGDRHKLDGFDPDKHGYGALLELIKPKTDVLGIRKVNFI